MSMHSVPQSLWECPIRYPTISPNKSRVPCPYIGVYVVSEGGTLQCEFLFQYPRHMLCTCTHLFAATCYHRCAPSTADAASACFSSVDSAVIEWATVLPSHLDPLYTHIVLGWWKCLNFCPCKEIQFRYKTDRMSFVTKRRNSWACRGNPNPEQETIKGTHTQETPAYQRRMSFSFLFFC